MDGAKLKRFPQRIKGLLQKTEETKCQYSTRTKNNQCYTTIHCERCPEDSSLRSPRCRKNVLQILQVEFHTDCLTLAKPYEREYRDEALELLKALAKLQNLIGALTTTPKLECNSCEWKEIIELFKLDPAKAFFRLKIRREKNCSVYGCECAYQEILDSILKNAPFSAIKDEFDYDRDINPYIRPRFSSTRIDLEPPEGAIFLRSYEIGAQGRRPVRIAIYRLSDKPENIYFMLPVEYNLPVEELQLLIDAKGKLIRQRPKTAKFSDPDSARDFLVEKGREIISQLAKNKKLNLSTEAINCLADLFAKYTAGFGILEDILLDPNVQDVYVNAPVARNPVHMLVQGEECSSNIFLSEDDVGSLISRLRSLSGRPFSEANPVLDTDLEQYHTRVAAIGSPLSSSGLAYAFRRHRSEPWTLLHLIANNTLSPYAAGLLSFLVDGQASILVTGSRGAGKTSLLSALMLEIPQKFRVITIEDTRELPVARLQTLGWKVQGLTTRSAVAGSASEMEPDEALRAALRLGESVLVIGEVRGREARVLYEAMRVGAAGNSVMGTIHGSTTKEVYDRVVYDLEVPPSSFRATDIIVVCAPIRPGGGLSRMRRIRQVSEVLKEESNSNSIFEDLMEYSPEKDVLRPLQVLDMGKSEAIKSIAAKWGITIEEALENIALREKIKQVQVECSHRLNNPELLGAEASGSANNKFWLLIDEYQQRGELDLHQMENDWVEWFRGFALNYERV